MATPLIAHGSKFGMHSIRPGQVIPLVRQAHDRGVVWPLVKSVDNGGVAIDVKKIEPRTLTLVRFVNNDEDAAQDVGGWTQADMRAHAQKAVDAIWKRLNHDEKAAADWFEPINEADPPGVDGWRAFGEYIKIIVEEGNQRGMKLALPAFCAGTPEWDEAQALVGTGVFAAMKAGGHILTIHEGVLGDAAAVQDGFGNGIPGAPVVPGAGSMCFRYRYLYSLLQARDEVVPLVVSEFYAGGGYGLPPAEHVKRFAWYDQLARQDPYVLAVLPFTIDPDPGWSHQDYTKVYPALLDYLVAEKDKPNTVTPAATPAPTPVPVVTVKPNPAPAPAPTPVPAVTAKPNPSGTPTLLTDWSMYQSNFIGDGKVFADLYNPDKWIVDIDFNAVAASGVAAVFIRVGLSQHKDPCFDRYLAGIKQVGLPWGIYHAYDPDRSPVGQADLVRAWCPENPPLGVFGDIELGNAVFDGANAYLEALDARFGLTAGIYSANWYLAPHFSVAEQTRWRARPAWFAGYPNLVVPAGWAGQPMEYTVHQYSESATLAGVPRPTDMDRLHPSLILEDLMAAQPAVTHPVMTNTVVINPPAATLTTRLGLHGRADGRMQTPDFQAVRDARAEAVKLMSTADPADFDKLQAIDSKIFVMVRCFADFRNRVLPAQDFAHSMAGDLAPFYAKGIRHFEVHNEPNTPIEGLRLPGHVGSWADGAEFGNWFTAVVAQLRQTFPEAKWGWPGLSPGQDADGQRADADRFLTEAGSAPASADWIGIHAYWLNDDGPNENGLQAAIDSVAAYAARFPGHTLYVTEFANPAPAAQVDMATKARQYLAFWQGMRPLPVAAVFSFVSSASNQDFKDQSWRDESGQLSAIPGIVGARTVLPARWWDAWPSGVFASPSRLASPPAAIQIVDASGQPLVPPTSRQNAMDVFERQGDLLRVLDQPLHGQIWWVRASDVEPA